MSGARFDKSPQYHVRHAGDIRKVIRRARGSHKAQQRQHARDVQPFLLTAAPNSTGPHGTHTSADQLAKGLTRLGINVGAQGIESLHRVGSHALSSIAYLAPGGIDYKSPERPIPPAGRRQYHTEIATRASGRMQDILTPPPAPSAATDQHTHPERRHNPAPQPEPALTAHAVPHGASSGTRGSRGGTAKGSKQPQATPVRTRRAQTTGGSGRGSAKDVSTADDESKSDGGGGRDRDQDPFRAPDWSALDTPVSGTGDAAAAARDMLAGGTDSASVYSNQAPRDDWRSKAPQPLNDPRANLFQSPIRAGKAEPAVSARPPDSRKLLRSVRAQLQQRGVTSRQLYMRAPKGRSGVIAQGELSTALRKSGVMLTAAERKVLFDELHHGTGVIDYEDLNDTLFAPDRPVLETTRAAHHTATGYATGGGGLGPYPISLHGDKRKQYPPTLPIHPHTPPHNAAPFDDHGDLVLEQEQEHPAGGGGPASPLRRATRGGGSMGVWGGGEVRAAGMASPAHRRSKREDVFHADGKEAPELERTHVDGCHIGRSRRHYIVPANAPAVYGPALVARDAFGSPVKHTGGGGVRRDAKQARVEGAENQLLRRVMRKLNERHRTAKDAFLHLNEDRDGAIDVEELREGLRSMGEPLTDGEFAVLVRRLDDNATGKVNYREFANAFKEDDPLPEDYHASDERLDARPQLTTGDVSMLALNRPRHRYHPTLNQGQHNITRTTADSSGATGGLSHTAEQPVLAASVQHAKVVSTVRDKIQSKYGKGGGDGLRQAWQRLPRDGRGLSVQQLRPGLLQQGIHLTDGEVRALVEGGGGGRQSRDTISFAEFRQLLQPVALNEGDGDEPVVRPNHNAASDRERHPGRAFHEGYGRFGWLSANSRSHSSQPGNAPPLQARNVEFTRFSVDRARGRSQRRGSLDGGEQGRQQGWGGFHQTPAAGRSRSHSVPPSSSAGQVRAAVDEDPFADVPVAGDIAPRVQRRAMTNPLFPSSRGEAARRVVQGHGVPLGGPQDAALVGQAWQKGRATVPGPATTDVPLVPPFLGTGDTAVPYGHGGGRSVGGAAGLSSSDAHYSRPHTHDLPARRHFVRQSAASSNLFSGLKYPSSR